LHILSSICTSGRNGRASGHSREEEEGHFGAKEIFLRAHGV